ncbi:hypothetical protein FAK_17800 [Desulfoferula mesophila]|uniref:Uncharacterized protein n=1 Tax=Desulfoferula mesophila TaxID=3058419 RepID=A0AAU9EHI3_9BACT|nr:hypothetical protein FAK_17800 [Desulfoferula mesophilus]
MPPSYRNEPGAFQYPDGFTHGGTTNGQLASQFWLRRQLIAGLEVAPKNCDADTINHLMIKAFIPYRTKGGTCVGH